MRLKTPTMDVPARILEATGAARGFDGSHGGPDKVIVRDLTKVFTIKGEPLTAIDRFNLNVRAGEFVSIVGPSGCGKSTFLRILGQLDAHTSGHVELIQSPEPRPLASMVFQDQSAFPWMSVEDNVGYGLRMRSAPQAQIVEQVDYWLNATGLAKFRKAYPYQLSGGMRQRVSIARAFANDPEILLMDEPFAALDALTKTVMQDELLGLWEKTRKTVIYITHGLDEALTLSDRIVVMTARPGRIKAIIDVPFERPRNGLAIKTDPRYARMYAEIWELLRAEVMKPEVKDAH